MIAQPLLLTLTVPVVRLLGQGGGLDPQGDPARKGLELAHCFSHHSAGCVYGYSHSRRFLVSYRFGYQCILSA